MDMNGERLLPAPRQTVWAALNNPEILKVAIPGCEKLEATSPAASVPAASSATLPPGVPRQTPRRTTPPPAA